MKVTQKTQPHLAVCKIMWDVIRREWQGGWTKLGDDIKRAIISERVLCVLVERASFSPPTQDEIIELRQAMMDFCGIDW